MDACYYDLSVLERLGKQFPIELRKPSDQVKNEWGSDKLWHLEVIGVYLFVMPVTHTSVKGQGNTPEEAIKNWFDQMRTGYSVANFYDRQSGNYWMKCHVDGVNLIIDGKFEYWNTPDNLSANPQCATAAD